MGDIQDSIDKKEREKEDMAPEKGQEPAEMGKPASKEVDRPAGLRFFQFWFHRQTRFGRFNRAAMRWLAITIILFALGLLACIYGRDMERIAEGIKKVGEGLRK